MLSQAYKIDFTIVFNAYLMGSQIDGLAYCELYERAGLDAESISSIVTSTVYENVEILEYDIERFLKKECNVNRQMTFAYDITFDGIYGSIKIQFESVTDDQITNEMISDLAAFLREYNLGICVVIHDEPMSVCVAAGADRSLLRLGNLYNKLFDTWETIGISRSDLYSSQFQYLARVFEGASIDESKCMQALDEFKMDDDVREELKQQYKEIFGILTLAQKQVSGVSYRPDKERFMAETCTKLRMRFINVEIV